MSRRTSRNEAVIARYITVAGSSLGREDLTVDLTYQLGVREPHEPFATLASCAACPAREEFNHYVGSGSHFDGSYKEERYEEQANIQARAWAQKHAEKCRAVTEFIA